MSLELEHSVVLFLIALTAVLHQLWERNRHARRTQKRRRSTRLQTTPSANT